MSFWAAITDPCAVSVAVGTSGDHLVAERREVLRQFAGGIDAENKRVHRAFLASVRVLGEGVDIVGERGVEAVCFADTRGSQVEIVQNIGRALRPNPDGTTKIARIIVPIFLEPGEDPDDMVASASFRPLVAVLQGLRSHDERLVEQLHQQRRAYQAGELEPRRKEQLEEEGMVWEPGDEAWETKLAALRSYHRAHNHLAPRQDAVWGESDDDVQPIGQHMANLRRKGGLGKVPERAEDRARQLAAIDPNWDCPWPLDWQRHYRVLADLVDADGTLPDIQPGVLFEGDDLGKWVARQASD